MNPEVIKRIKKNILKEQRKVAQSKSAATKYLIELGILTKQGKVKKQFKALQAQ